MTPRYANRAPSDDCRAVRTKPTVARSARTHGPRRQSVFSSRRRHTRYWRDWSSDCALPISVACGEILLEDVDHVDVAGFAAGADRVRNDDSVLGFPCVQRLAGVVELERQQVDRKSVV